MNRLTFLLLLSVLFISCSKDADYKTIDSDEVIAATFGTNISLNSLANYANQAVPSYITIDNTNGNPITDKGATLGRVLFYDKNLSKNNTISCSSCHKQALGFGDDAVASIGVNGSTGRHSMRLINNRFSLESRYFWDERADDLEMQTTMPVKDHAEMGYSGANGDEAIDKMIAKISQLNYYKVLFKFAFGSEEISEDKIQLALAQFVRSIQSFDSKFDTGKATATFDTDVFANYTAQEQQGKNLFLTEAMYDALGNRTGGGIACANCHQTPTFSIDPLAKNNGLISKLGNPDAVDVNNTKAPTLRDVFNTNGVLNGPLMHTGISLNEVYNHYSVSQENPLNTNLDVRFFPNGNYLKINITRQERDAVTAFLKTLSGTNVYVDAKWSDPFLN